MNDLPVQEMKEKILEVLIEQARRRSDGIVLLAPIGLALSRCFKGKIPPDFKLKSFIKNNMSESIDILTNPKDKTFCALTLKKSDGKFDLVVENKEEHVSVNEYDTIFDFLVNHLSNNEMKLINIPLNLLAKKTKGSL